MSLTKNDLQQIRGVVKEEVKEEIGQAIETKVRPIIKEEIGQAIETKVRPIIKEEIDKAIDFKVRPIIKEEVEGLAIMVKNGFDSVTKEIAGIKTDIADHDFKMTELVPKVQHFYLEQRVGRIEEKVGIRRKKL